MADASALNAEATCIVLQNIRQPQHLQQGMTHLFATLSLLGPHASQLVDAARHALLAATHTPLGPMSPAVPSAGDDRAIVFIAEWYVRTVLLDTAGSDVTFNLDR